MITGIHFLLTYSCNLTCDHCFLFCSPTSKGTMTVGQVRTVLEESKGMGTVREAYFEGGEPFLFYAALVESVRLARETGLEAGIVTNGYWATSVEDAKLWLVPLSQLIVSDFSVSDDELHYGNRADSPARYALNAAKLLGMPANSLCKAKPVIQQGLDSHSEKGAPEISGGIKLRGRAVEKLLDGLPARKRRELKECPYEDLADPKRIHIDSYGTVQICQGISMGNCWKTPLSELAGDYDAEKHPICGPLVRGGPLGLVEEYRLDLKGEYVDECHLCYAARVELLARFPEYLAPRQVYGLE